MLITPVWRTVLAGCLAMRLGFAVFAGPLDERIAGPQATWQPGAGSPAPQRIQSAGASVLRFPCPFAASASRVFWDLPCTLDLRAAAGVQVRFRCANLGAIAKCFLYLKSGDGWYGGLLTPRGDGTLESVVLWKAGTFVEGTPAGWGRIDGIRLAATPAGHTDTAFDLAGLSIVPADVRLAVLRNTAGLRTQDANDKRSITDFPERLTKALHRVRVFPAFVDDPDVEDGFLQRQHVQVLFLPYNAKMPPATLAAVRAFVRGGGKTIGFFTPPAGLTELLGARFGDYVPATKVAGGFGTIRFGAGGPAGVPSSVAQNSWMVQDTRPEAGRSRVVASWSSQGGAETGFPAVLQTSCGWWMTHVYLDADPADGARMLLALAATAIPDLWRAAATTAAQELARLPLTGAGLARARQWQATALQQLAAGSYPAALAAADECRREYESALVAAIPAAANEFRGAWCHRGYGIQGWTWDQTVRQLQGCGFTALFANLAWGGVSWYPSRYLPAATDHPGDQLRLCADACRKYGVQLHVWLACLNVGDCPSKDWLAALARDGRLQRNAHNAVNPRWLCPSHPDNRQLLANVAREIVRTYHPDGLHLDFIRYPDQAHCFCPGCHSAFERAIGRRLNAWPQDVQTSPELAAAWLSFRRGLITSLVKELRAAVKQESRAARLSAAVFDSFETARDSVGQDWMAWARNGDIDFAVPMIYTADDALFANTVRRQRAALRGAPTKLYPGIGARTARLTPLQTASQIVSTRQLGTGGFVIFEFNSDEATRLFPELAKGVTRPPR